MVSLSDTARRPAALRGVRRAVAIAAVALLAACSVVQQSADEIARDRARVVVGNVVERNFPGVNAAPVTDCIIDAASAQEILTIATDSLTGVQPETATLVLEIAQRPDSVQCIARNALQLI
ncbi:succinate dehydrogenase [Mesobacterium pallidum]|uniref:succinate dehydrogenase n=1 Tax=Mesobacterium pallidum TaxID=2872037 RepID=UPI001EE2EE58|nr:succinate dehydrogenase [Mesobacterium pallidum]